MKTRPGLLLALVLVVVAGAYVTALSVGFVWDDRVLADSWNARPDLKTALLGPFWGQRGASEPIAPYFRPVVSLSLLLDQHLYGDRPVGFHITNVVLHLLACLVFYALCRRFRAPSAAALLATLVLGGHARLTECITWISGRTDVLAALLGFAAVVVWPRSEAKARGRQLLAALLFAAAFLAKETALAVAVALLVADVGFREGSDERGPWRRGLRFWPIVVALVLAAVERNVVLRTSTASENELSLADRAVASLEAIGRYAGMVADPWHPRLRIGQVDEHAWGFVVAGAGLVALILALVTMALRRRGRPGETPWLAPGERFGLTLAALAIAFVLPLGPARISVVAADRFLYLPIAGLALAAAVASGRLHGLRSPRIPIIPVVAALVAVFALSSLACIPGRNDVWADELELWLQTSETAAHGDVVPLTSLAATLLRGDAYEDALRLHAKVADLLGDRQPAEEARSCFRAAVAASFLGDLELWQALVDRAIRSAGPTPQLVCSRARAELARGDFAAARRDGDASCPPGHGIYTRELEPPEPFPTLIDRAERTERELASEPPSPARTLREAVLATSVDRRRQARASWQEIAFDEPPDAFTRYPAEKAQTLYAAAEALLHSGDTRTVDDDQRASLVLARESKRYYSGSLSMPEVAFELPALESIDPRFSEFFIVLTARRAFAEELEAVRPRLTALEQR